MKEYHRHLPHQIPDGAPIFLTWNLKGALPGHVIEQLEHYRHQLEQRGPQAGESPRERSIRLGKLHFAAADRELDGATTGPMFLREPELATIVEEAILFGCAERYKLWAWCVMPNHVHVLLTPIWELERVTKGLKGYTSRQINLHQNAPGRSVWQGESYDHWVRDADEFERIVFYIENNPVKAKLCQAQADWQWSSARFRTQWAAAMPFNLGLVRMPC
jgi:putative transposase